MRRLLLFVSFLLLVAGLLTLWRCRFERIPGTQALTLSDLRRAVPTIPPGAVWEGSAEKPVLRLWVDSAHPRVGMRMELPGFPAIKGLHIRFNMTARNLKLGPQKWDDGRALIEWRSPGGTAGQDTSPVGALRDNEVSGDISLVVRPSYGSSVPVLRVEHLGSGGEFTISNLEMVPVRERAVWKYGQWAMLGACFAWTLVFLSGAGRRSVWRRMAAAGIVVGMVVFFAVPGPWKTLRPLVIPFEIGVAVPLADHGGVAAKGVRNGPVSVLSNSLAASEMQARIPVQGGWIIQIKSHLALLRPLLHALLLFFPTLALAWLVGARPAMVLNAGLAIMIEAAQTAFGYGFDFVDLFDLASDALGIALAVWIFGKLREMHGGRQPTPA